jgi:hypothetical protein
MECPKCGVANKDDLEKCRMCGTDLRPRRGPTGSTKSCPFCKALNESDAVFCISCNRPFGEQKGPSVDAIFGKDKAQKYYDRTYADAPSSALRAARTGTAGIILLMITLWAFLDIIFTLGIGYTVTQMDEFDQLEHDNPQLKSFFADLTVCESIRVVFMLLAFVGAITSIRRLNFGLALIGAIFALLLMISSILALLWGVWFLITVVLFFASIVALLLIVFSRREFMLT